MAATARSAISEKSNISELLPPLTLMEMEQVSPLSEIVIPSQNPESISSPRLSRFLWASFNLLGMKSPTRTLALLMWYLHATTQGIARSVYKITISSKHLSCQSCDDRGSRSGEFNAKRELNWGIIRLWVLNIFGALPAKHVGNFRIGSRLSLHDPYQSPVNHLSLKNLIRSFETLDQFKA